MAVVNQQSIIGLVRTRPPQSATKLVDRQAISLLQQAQQSGMNALVLAPAGYGKTSLLVQYYNHLQNDNAQVAWLSLSEDDTDPAHFLAGISAAIHALGGTVGSVTHSLLGAGLGVSYSVILTTLMNELMLAGESITLFIDDLHRAESKAFQDILTEMLEGAPGNLRLILSSRSAFPAFSRMRARRRLLEVTSVDLRVTYPEATDILASTCSRELKGEQVITLLGRVDGWINGLQIAALSIDENTDIDAYVHGFSGQGRDFSEYIEHDIFARLTAATQKFLIETSILEVLTPQLCDVVTQGAESAVLLAELRRTNLFLVTLDEQHQCYRYNPIFREFLQAKLSSELGEDKRSVHKRAYEWCLENGLIREAINHIVIAKDWGSAADAIELHLEEALSRNRLSTLENWILALPQDLRESRPRLLLGLGWVAILRRNVTKAYNFLDLAESCFASLDDADAAAGSGIRSDVVALRGVITVVSDNADAIAELAATADIEIPEEQAFFRATYITALVYALMYEGKFDQGHRLAMDLEVASPEFNFRAVVYTHIFRGLGYPLSGHFDNAKQQYEQAQRIARQKFGDHWVPFAVPSALLAEIEYERGDLSAASQSLKNRDIIRQESSVIEPLICAYQVSARLALQEGNPEKALQLLAEGEAVGRHDGFNRLVAAMLCERIRLLVNAEKMEAAAVAYHDLTALARQLSRADGWSELGFYVALGSSRYLLATQKAEEALALLGAQSVLAKRQGQNRHRVDILLQEGHALALLGKQRSALNRTCEAIVLGATGRFKRTFVDAEPSVRESICTVLKRWSHNDVSGERQVDEDYVEMLRSTFDVMESSPIEPDHEVDLAGIEPLTPREVTLLRLLGKGRKNKELAGEMNVSVHTIAWHLKNLYAKLGVDNRTAAVNVARQLRLE
ncbi:MAG: LuxR C-terminal-related transcriptional regulator [Pseudomonadota bacterium]